MYRLLISLLIVVLIPACQLKERSERTIEISELTIADIHQAYMSGDYNSLQLVEAYLERIEHFNEKINAITYINPEALSVAKLLDREYRKTKKLRPLHGIPIIVKDNINTRGIHTTAGSLALINYMPEENAFIIQKLVDAGVIILAKSNMAEWAFSPRFTESSTHGITRNPYDLDHVPAGSSGGTGAAIAANLGTLGLGTDTGNSIRGPSSHCGLVGFRTTIGLSSLNGIVPLSLRNDVVGPMCRTVADATKLMQAMMGYDLRDANTGYSKDRTVEDYTPFLDKDGLRGARIGVVKELSYGDTDPEIASLFVQALRHLDRLGARVIDSLEIRDFSGLKEGQWCNTFRKDMEAFLADNVKSDTLKTLEDLARAGFNSEIARNGFAYFADDNADDRPLEECLDAFTDPKRLAFRQTIEDLMDSLDLDALVYPSWTYPPGKIESYGEDYKGDNSQIIAPHTGQPAFTIPMGYTKGGLPAGLQFLGRMFDEPTLIKLTYSYEQGTKHRKPPIMY